LIFVMDCRVKPGNDERKVRDLPKRADGILAGPEPSTLPFGNKRFDGLLIGAVPWPIFRFGMVLKFVLAQSLRSTLRATSLQIAHHGWFNCGGINGEAPEAALQKVGCVFVVTGQRSQLRNGGAKIVRQMLHFGGVRLVELRKSRAALLPVLPRFAEQLSDIGALNGAFGRHLKPPLLVLNMPPIGASQIDPHQTEKQNVASRASRSVHGRPP
jgi:hypothetical protein